MNQERLSRETLKRALELAGLDLSDARIEELLPRFESLLMGMRSLSELDLSAVEPAAIFSAGQE